MDLDGFIILASAVLLLVCVIGKWWCDSHVYLKYQGMRRR